LLFQIWNLSISGLNLHMKKLEGLNLLILQL
jgi:hypothetical protein